MATWTRVTLCLTVAAICAIPLFSPRSATGTSRERSPSVTLVAVGDILLDRGVARNIERFGTGYPFENVAHILSSADVAFGNLECPIAVNGQRVLKRFSFKAKPSSAQALVQGGMKMLSTANNHSMDCGRTGLVETMDTLRSKGIHWCGAGLNRVEAERPSILTMRGIRIAFVGFCDFIPEGSFLNADRPTLAFASEDTVRRVVSAARPRADIVVASFHWGIEFTGRPSERQIRLARIAVESGADLVLGHHPHVLQGIALLARSTRLPSLPGARSRRALVDYSLGNFVFDQRMGRNGRDTASIILRCTLSKHGVTSAEIIPVRLAACRPHLSAGADRSATLDRMALLSHELNTRIINGRVAGW